MHYVVKMLSIKTAIIKGTLNHCTSATANRPGFTQHLQPGQFVHPAQQQLCFHHCVRCVGPEIQGWIHAWFTPTRSGGKHPALRKPSWSILKMPLFFKDKYIT